MARLAWFSPMPPVATGVATCSADLLPQLGRTHEIDVFVDEPVVRIAAGVRSAHDFVWRHRQRPYDLTVFQVGNSSHHDYLWPYLFRYPGLTVLHDAHLHHARAAALLRNDRADDYRQEFVANHPATTADLAELAIAGFDSRLYYNWPMTRLVAERSRLVAVHSAPLAEELASDVPAARVRAIRLGHGIRLSNEESAAASNRARARYQIPQDAIVFGCYGGLSPDKRLPQILAALAATRVYIPAAHLLLAGGVPEHYDLADDVERLGLNSAVTVTGYLPTDEDFTASIAACDVALNLRWPSAREVSGPWLRCLAAGKPTVIIDLAHMSDVPTLDPRTWQPNIRTAAGRRPGVTTSSAPCAVAVDILDEDHSLRLAMRRLGSDALLRSALGRAAQEYWQSAHSLEAMTSDYEELIRDAMQQPIPDIALPAHLIDNAEATMVSVLGHVGVAVPVDTRATPPVNPQ